MKTMVDVFRICNSESFLAGGCSCAQRNFEFPGKRPWRWEIVGVDKYIGAVEQNQQEKPNVISILEERYLSRLRGIYGQIFSAGTGDAVEAARNQQDELSNLLAASFQIRKLTDAISAASDVDSNMVHAFLAEMPFGQLDVALMLNSFLPNVEFPLVSVITDAYQEGLFPFGVFNGVLDNTYVGPDVLYCLDAQAL